MNAPSAQKPSIGRIVHYWVLNTEECQNEPNPAIITRVNPDGTCDLQVFGDVPYDDKDSAGERLGIRRSRPEGTDGRSGTWNWPPRA